MTDQQAGVLAGAEGVGAEIAWVVVYILCWFFMIFPFVLWYAGVRTPRSQRHARTTRIEEDPGLEDDEARQPVRTAG